MRKEFKGFINDISWTRKIKYVTDVLTKGEQVELVIIDINKDGKSIFTDENDNTFYLDTKEERIRLIKETPNILGAHAGGNWESRRQSHKDVVSFFQKHLLS